jgi:putative copper export protein
MSLQSDACLPTAKVFPLSLRLERRPSAFDALLTHRAGRALLMGSLLAARRVFHALPRQKRLARSPIASFAARMLYAVEVSSAAPHLAGHHSMKRLTDIPHTGADGTNVGCSEPVSVGP